MSHRTETIALPTLDGLASALHQALFSDLSPTGWHHASSCPYATAWALLASESAPMKQVRALRAGCLQYLLQTQQPNGSWGRLLHEQLMITPHAYVALRLAYEHSTQAGQYPLQHALLAARTFLRTRGTALYPRLPEEVLRCFHPLCAVAERAGHPEWVEPRRKMRLPPAKIGALPAPEQICLQLSGLCELLPAIWQSNDPADLEELAGRQLQNGSWWCVSDFTAMALLAMQFRGGAQAVHERGWQYLLAAQNSDGGLPQFHDCEVFLSAYVGFAHAALVRPLGLRFPGELQQMEPWLRAVQQAHGLWSFTQAFPGGDLDDTAWIVLWLVDGCGVAPSDPAVERAISALLAYQLPDGAFPSWAGLAGDPDVTAHVLHTLWAVGKGEEAAMHAKAYLLGRQGLNGAWQGIWHHSPIYGTAQALHALVRGPSDERTNAALLHGGEYLLSQLTGEHASWCGSLEETGMALWGLAAFAMARDEALPISRAALWNAIKQSLGELSQRIAQKGLDGLDNPALWIAQFSYTARPLQLATAAAIARATAAQNWP